MKKDKAPSVLIEGYIDRAEKPDGFKRHLFMEDWRKSMLAVSSKVTISLILNGKNGKPVRILKNAAELKPKVLQITNEVLDRHGLPAITEAALFLPPAPSRSKRGDNLLILCNSEKGFDIGTRRKGQDQLRAKCVELVGHGYIERIGPNKYRTTDTGRVYLADDLPEVIVHMKGADGAALCMKSAVGLIADKDHPANCMRCKKAKINALRAKLFAVRKTARKKEVVK